MNRADFGVWLMCAAAALEVAAQDESADTGNFEFPVVLTASRLQQSAREAPAAVTVIDRELIERSGARRIEELLRLVPGFVVGHLNGNSPVATYHGLSDPFPRRMQVLVDGVSVYSPLFGGVEWSELPFAISDIERVEVVRGPNAASFGANAFLGVINIITRDPAGDRRARISSSVGGGGIQDLSGRVSGGEGDFRFQVTAGQRADRGFEGLPDSNRMNYAGLYLTKRLSGNEEVFLRYRLGQGEMEQGYYLPNSTNGPRTRHTDVHSVQVRWTRSESADDETWLQFSLQQRQQHETADFTLIRPLGIPGLVIPYPIHYDYDSRRRELEFQTTARPRADLRAVWGAQYRNDGVRSMPFFNSSEWISSNLVRAFGTVEWQSAENLTVHFGDMYEYNSITGSSWSPRLSVTMTPWSGQTLRSGVSVARRTPTLFENQTDQTYPLPGELRRRLLLFGPPLSTWANYPLLQQYKSTGSAHDERIVSREVAYLVEDAALRTNAEIRWFNDQIRDLIVVTERKFPYVLGGSPGTSSTGDFGNQESARQRGAEFSLRWRPTRDTLIHAVSARTITESMHNGNVTSLDYVKSLDNVRSLPVHTSAIHGSHRFAHGWVAGATWYRVGSMTWPGSNNNRLPAYDQWMVRVARDLRWGSQSGSIGIVTARMGSKELDAVRSRSFDRSTYLQFSIEY